MTDEQICKLAKDKALDIQKYIIDGNVDIDSCAKDCCLAGAHSRDEEVKQWKESKRRLRLRLMQIIHELRNPWISVEERLPEIGQGVVLRSWTGKSIYYDELCLGDLNFLKENKELWPYWMPIPQIEKEE